MRSEGEGFSENAPNSVILWMKIVDPTVTVPAFPKEADVRVLLPQGERFSDLRSRLLLDGILFREVRYLLEEETISTLNANGQLTVTFHPAGVSRPASAKARTLAGWAASAARDAFELMWQNHAVEEGVTFEFVPAEQIVPEGWLRYLPYPILNPAQAEAIPHIVSSNEHLMVVAPTGAGKTVIGMVAALRAVLEFRKKAAWLVPQRSLTDELNAELDSWRQRGLRVERLSGEYRVDARRVRDADLWVATTEKFEAICRTASLREALAEVDCLIIDEIHLIGDPSRGAFLEAILTRVHSNGPKMRIIGLSATVANAEELSGWLPARIVRVAWRPTLSTWQIPAVASSPDWSLVEGAKMRLTTAITRRFTADRGSVLVFCGSKRNVRRTALMIAASRGAEVYQLNPDDPDLVHRACAAVGVGLHFKGWEYKKEAEQAFRAREFDVLVATSTVAAGVNLPARAVIVQETEVGLKAIDIATVQQMFGRSGRVGAGESEGWAYLLVDDSERAAWQRRLLAGFRVNSQLHGSLPDHVLGEAVQGRIGSPADVEGWFARTLAYHQGNRDIHAVWRAIEFLIDSGFLRRGRHDGEVELVPTELGVLTARLMVSPYICHQLRTALGEVGVPNSADLAESRLIETIATQVPTLAHAGISEDLKPIAVELKLARGIILEASRRTHSVRSSAGSSAYSPGDLTIATLLTAANSPTSFLRDARYIGGIPYSTMYPILEEAPRYLHWLASQGILGTVHPWIAVVAADLGRRIRWRRCQPPRGSGRLLWMFEQMATPVYVDDVVPILWEAARARGLTSPDWTETGRPKDCKLGLLEYSALLRDRATGIVTGNGGEVVVTSSTIAVLVTWAGSDYLLAGPNRGRISVDFPADDTVERGAVTFTWRGDYQATGWLAEYVKSEPVPIRSDAGEL
ncbi:DEAD/DEAH box helicase [Nocardia sp. NPDC050697]|uniref:DEAD/DEAH box helicase n=1 Tax=Nocardia sp. NPDC050697 TaxID=3155158 RepID=UPI0033D13690